ncbi:MAG: D-alanyl-D-alanine carboxypeptidase, partial [Pyrinomonadaceae bacterium]
MTKQKIGQLLISVSLIWAFATINASAQESPIFTQTPRPAQVEIPTLPPGPVETATAVEDLATLRPEDLISTRDGVLVETLEGQTVMRQGADQGFNPASAIKLATALGALRSFGPQHRFSTGVWTNGNFDAATATVTGDLIVSGRDPSFHYEHAVLLARELNRLGVRTVTGDLIVAPRFTMNFMSSSLRSGEQLY